MLVLLVVYIRQYTVYTSNKKNHEHLLQEMNKKLTTIMSVQATPTAPIPTTPTPYSHQAITPVPQV